MYKVKKYVVRMGLTVCGKSCMIVIERMFERTHDRYFIKRGKESLFKESRENFKQQWDKWQEKVLIRQIR